MIVMMAAGGPVQTPTSMSPEHFTLHCVSARLPPRRLNRCAPPCTRQKNQDESAMSLLLQIRTLPRWLWRAVAGRVVCRMMRVMFGVRRRGSYKFRHPILGLSRLANGWNDGLAVFGSFSFDLDFVAAGRRVVRTTWRSLFEAR